MLKAITFNNFKSYRRTRLPLAPLTVMIGANASGKSNAIEGMRLLSWLAQGQRLSAIQYAVQGGDKVVRGRIEDLAYEQGELFGFGVETDTDEWNSLSMGITRRFDGLHITSETLTHEGATVPIYSLDQPSGQQGTDACVAYNNFTRGRNKPHVICSDQAAIFTQLTAPAAFDATHKMSRERIPPVLKQLERWLSAILFLDPVPAEMRDYAFPSDTVLQGNGKNVSAVLYNLWYEDTQAQINLFGSDDPVVISTSNRQSILGFIQSLPEQDISDLSFLREPRGGVMVKLTETFGGRSKDYDASLLSDGTLRVLAIAAAMLSAPEGSLVVIEEIDNGVHPNRAHHLLQQIQQIAQDRSLRVLLSTHNPAMLDALPDSAVPDVVFCYRDPVDGSSRLVRLANVPDFPELIAQGTLGHLMTSGTLERFVKYHPHGEERKRRALEWLDKMRAEGANG
ncbi:MAG: ATP-binding protein [Chlorobiales bacterium]|nr:ATP-binding protein [Chlorobiales bacterium]